MTYAEQLEHETEQTRSQLASTLQELRASITPGEVVNQITDFATDGDAAEFFRNLKHQVARNPLPVSLIGAGLAWLMVANRKGANGGADGHMRRGLSEAGERAGKVGGEASAAVSDSTRSATEWAKRTSEGLKETAADWSERASSAASAIGESAADKRARFSETAASAASSIRETASSAYDSVAGGTSRATAAMSETGKTLGHNALHGTQAFVAFCREQPMVVAGLGAAVGAIIGALLPSTEAEHRAMGQASDDIKRKVADIASETAKSGMENAAAVAEEHEQAGTRSASEPDKPDHASADEAGLVPSAEGDSHNRDEDKAQKTHVSG